jgi:hypothetical protein
LEGAFQTSPLDIKKKKCRSCLNPEGNRKQEIILISQSFERKFFRS